MSKPVIVTGAFDDLRSRDVRLLEEAAKLGPLTVLLFTDELVRTLTGANPKFPWAERLYLVKALRFVSDVLPFYGDRLDALPVVPGLSPAVWADAHGADNEARARFCSGHGIQYHLFTPEQLAGFPDSAPVSLASQQRKKVIVTGCYDWLHSGHVRFFEEVSAYGDLYVVIGHDANIRLLKGEGHPLQPQEERRYMVGAVSYVTQALVSSGNGWLDADPEIHQLKPHIYAVNEDGDRGGKREYCARQGIEYLVLKRIPASGLPARSSTNLRGF